MSDSHNDDRNPTAPADPGDPKPAAATTDDQPLGEGGKAALDAERAARKAAEKDARALRERLDAIDAAARKREEDDAARKGEFEALAAKREQERDAAKADVARLTAENDQLRAAMAAGVAARWEELPERVQKLFKGDAEDPLARWTYLNDPDVQALAKDLTEKEPPARGNGHDPRPGGPAAPSLNDEMRSLAARGGYAM